MTAHQYQYDALTHSQSEIRILSLLPSRDCNAPLRGRLTVESTSVRYEALSYVWGDQKSNRCLHIGDEELAISKGLSQALRRLRLPTRCRDLWIDAICINQRDSEEKNHQVEQMYNIYSRAARVLIWLGKGNRDTDEAMDLIMENRLPHEDQLVVTLFELPWWGRIWTLQEGLAATSDAVMICGNKEVPWWLVHSAIIRLIVVHRRHIPGLAAFSHINTHRRYDRTTFEDLVYASITREGTDPRDHVYALLGLVQINRGLLFEPDYKQSVAWAYSMGTVCVIEQRQDLEFLTLRARQKVELVPSWCFDFSQKEVLRNTGRSDHRTVTSRSYFASSNEEHRFRFAYDASEGSITVSGVIVGTIVSVLQAESPNKPGSLEQEGGPQSSKTEALFDVVRSFTTICRDAWSQRRARYFANATIRRGEVWRIVAGACHTNDEDLWDAVSGDPTVFSALTSLTERAITPSDLDQDVQQAVETHAAYLAESCMGKKSFFVTDSNYAGCASNKTRKGDIVCILFGCKLPLVLRPWDDGSYTIVDGAYVDDTMTGYFLVSHCLAEVQFTLK